MNTSTLTPRSFDISDGTPLWVRVEDARATPSHGGLHVVLNVKDLEDFDGILQSQFLEDWASAIGFSMTGISPRDALLSLFEVAVVAAGVELGIGPSLAAKLSDVKAGRALRGRFPHFCVALDIRAMTLRLVMMADGPFASEAALEAAWRRRVIPLELRRSSHR